MADRLGAFLPFEAARLVINTFCKSANLQRRPGDGVEVEPSAEHCRGTYLYAAIVYDGGDLSSDPIPHVSRFLTREQALIKNPDLARITLQSEGVSLPVVTNPRGHLRETANWS